MRFYQLHRTHEAGASTGYEYFASKREAEKARNHWLKQGDELEHGAEIKVIDIEPTRVGILEALNRLAGHADNG